MNIYNLRYIKNILYNWSGVICNMIIMFFLTPFIIHTLGNTLYGLWALVISLTGYLGLVDVGVKVSTGRFINYYIGRKESHEVSKVVNTSILFYSLCSLVIILLSVLLAFNIQFLFSKISETYVHEVRYIIILMGFNIWIGFLTSVFEQLLNSNNRFDLSNICRISSLIFRAVLIIIAFHLGYKIIALAYIHVMTNLLALFLLIFFANKKGTFYHFKLSESNIETFKTVFHFGIWAFLGNLAVQLVYYSDSIVIGLLIGAEAIALYNVGYILLDNFRKLLRVIPRSFSPDIMKYSGANDYENLFHINRKSMSIITFLVVPVVFGIFFFGDEFIQLWIGDGYRKSYYVLIILTVSQIGSLLNAPLALTLVGLGYVKVHSFLSALEGLVNLFLSVVFVVFFHLDIIGVALGSMISLIIFNNFGVPFLLSRYVQFWVISLYSQIIPRFLLYSCLFVLFSSLGQLLISLETWASFFLCVFFSVFLYLLFGLFFHKEYNLVRLIKKQVST